MLKALVSDKFTWLLIITMIIATLVPAQGSGAVATNWLTNAAIVGLFYLHGAKLSRQAVIDGMLHWRLHTLVFVSTFIIFPILGFTLKPVLSGLVTPELYTGVLFLCMLPSTVQSSIAFTSMAKGNVPSAVCSASVSSLIGIFITPLMVAFLLGTKQAGLSLESVGDILLLLLIPFVVGQLSQRWAGAFIRRHPSLVHFFDQGSILLIVYSAFSESVVNGLWQKTSLSALLGLFVICVVLLAAMLVFTWQASKRLGFKREDEVAIVFCGSKKSMANGIPLAKVIFSTQGLGAIVLPLMMFHQFQLMVCAVIAQHYAAKSEATPQGGEQPG